MQHKIKIKLFIILGLCYSFFPLLTAEIPVWTFNSLQEINSCQGKVILKLVRVWGGDEDDDEQKFFRFPNGIAVSADGSVYILEYNNHRVQVFTREGIYKKTIGRNGQGPGDLWRPCALTLDNNDHLIVLDGGNYRVQYFDANGKYLRSFKTPNSTSNQICVTSKGKIVIAFFNQPLVSQTLVTVFDDQGKIERKFGTPNYSQRSILDTENGEGSLIDTDQQGDIYVAFMCTPYYRKYRVDGKSLAISTFETPFEIPPPAKDPRNGEPKIGKKFNKQVTVGITTDSFNRVYLAVTRRDMKESERYGLVMSDHNIRRWPKVIETDQTDRFRLLVFNPQGKIMAAAQLNVFVDHIFVHDDYLFIIDTYMGMKIYEYKLTYISP